MTKHRYECPCGDWHPTRKDALQCIRCPRYLVMGNLSRKECPIIKHKIEEIANNH